MGLPKQFPKNNSVKRTNNPAFVLFGARFFIDQTVTELLSEFLNLIYSSKWIGAKGPINSVFPSMEQLKEWSLLDSGLAYRPPIKLSLKLFSLLAASRLDTRHQVHIEQYEYLSKKFIENTRGIATDAGFVKDWTEDFLMSFQAAGFDRNWSAQSLYPITSSFMLRETTWEKRMGRNKELSWDKVLANVNDFFGLTKHLFLARGGEVLYLQLCNLFAGKHVTSLQEDLGHCKQRYALENVYNSLVKGFGVLEEQIPRPLDDMANFIENLDSNTMKATDIDNKLWCEWCPEESWPEAYLFAIELSRILTAIMDPVEKLEMLKFGCALQVMRSMCAQSVRYSDLVSDDHLGGLLGYAWLFSPMQRFSRQQRFASCQNVSFISRIIQDALQTISGKMSSSEPIVSGNRLDLGYGFKFFIREGKRLQIIYPPRGAEPRFVVTDTLIRYLILAVLEPHTSCTYEEFKMKIFMHHGIAVEGQELQDAIAWTCLPVNDSIQPTGDFWFKEMLRAGGFLTELSDGFSIVRNPFTPQL